ncbi:small ribosomal subunit Rsm22 family protein [bacterium]|nr:small ribosomal subunit Rsm22 family protein [bacterium]
MMNASIRARAAAEAPAFDVGDRLQAHVAALEKLAFGASAGGRPPAVAAAGAALKSLQRGLTGDRRLAGEGYFSKADYLKAYLLYYWPVSFVQATMALEELRSRGELPRIRAILDIGAGPGPASFAAMGAAADGVASATLVDWNAEALEAAARLAAIEAHAPNALTLVKRNLESDPRLEGGPYDLIVACHSANEFWKEGADSLERRASLFRQACGLLAEGGVLLVIEPSATVTCRPALALRDRLLAEGGLRCAGPCPGSFPCPIAAAGGERSCHSTWPWTPPPMVADLARAAGLDRDSAKATWFALKKASAGEAAGRTAASGAAEEAASPTLAGRVVSEPMLNKAGRVRYILCTPNGLATLSAKRDDPTAQESGFLALRRGDCLRASGLERREGENNFGIAPGTKLELTFRAPDAGGGDAPQPKPLASRKAP